jgi:hypothetical protein
MCLYLPSSHAQKAVIYITSLQVHSTQVARVVKVEVECGT